MTKFIQLLFILCCFSFTAFAAEPAFIVFYNSGKAIKTANGKPVVLKKGDQLLSTDLVTLPTKTQLVLICANFSVLQLKAKGNYALDTLTKKCKVASASASSAYFKYMWSQFSHAHKAPDADPRAYMKTYGAASRGKSVITTVNTDTIYYRNRPLQIGWQQNKPQTVMVYAVEEDRRLILTAKPGQKANIDSIAKSLGKPGSYYWEFVGEESAKFRVLQLLPKKQYEQLKASILANVIATTPAETAYLTGYLFEEKHFLAEAAKYYAKALKLMPENESYQSAARRFMP